MNNLKPPKELRNGFKDPKRLAAIHNLRCALCFFLRIKQTSKTIAHHQIGKGLGKKASDRLTTSLCEDHHTKGQDAIHHIGRVAWEEKFGITEGDLILLTDKMLEHESN